MNKELKMGLLIAGYEKQDDDGIITYTNGTEKITISHGSILHEDLSTSSCLTRREGLHSKSICRLFYNYNDLLLFLDGSIV